MDKKLKPCPHCGSAAELKEAHYLESERPYSYVHCSNQQCDLHHQNTAHFSSPDEAKNSDEAIAAWNRKAEMSLAASEAAPELRGRTASASHSVP